MIYSPSNYYNFVKGLAIANSILLHDDVNHKSFFGANQIQFFTELLAAGDNKYKNWAVLIMAQNRIDPRNLQASNFKGGLNITFDIVQPLKGINDNTEHLTVLDNTYKASAEMVSQVYENYRASVDEGELDFLHGLEMDAACSIVEIDEPMFNKTIGFTVTIPVWVKWK